MNILDVSDPQVVLRNAKKYYGRGVQIYLSSNKNKKYMILHPETGKRVHFGSILFEDFTKHKDETRREKFRSRNRRWQDAEPYTASHLSYYLLW
jgi:hypothetical protein